MKVLFVTLDKCPNCDAGAVRTHMIAKMLIDNKHEVTVLSMGPYNNGKSLYVEGIEYISFRPERETFIDKAVAYSFFSVKLKRFLKAKKYDVCIHTQVDSFTLKVLKKYVQKNCANIVYDAVEWFSPEQFKQGKSAHTYKLNNNYNTSYIVGKHKVIAISSYLYNNFIKQKADTFLMPVVLDVDSISFEKKEGNARKTIMYAGVPGKKDYLDVVIKGLSLLDKNEKRQLSFRIIGCTKEQFLENTSLADNTVALVEECVEFLGRIPREAVLQEYSKADFSVLIRPTKARYAQAGFPTKLVESLSTATPVICNYTSDIEHYVTHLKNGVVVNGEDECACVDALRCIIRLDRNSVTKMQRNARDTAEKNFDYKIFSSELVKFLRG